MMLMMVVTTTMVVVMMIIMVVVVLVVCAALAKSISPLANANKTRVGLIETSQALAQMANKNS